MNRTTWIIIGVLCVLGFAGLVLMTKKDTVNVDSVNPTSIIASTSTTIGDHVFGNDKAKVVVFEYGDYQCPGCAGANKNMSIIRKLYQDKVAFVFRNYPLTTIHPNSLAASTVAEAAGIQGKYWEMGDLLFNRREEWVNLSAGSRGEKFNEFAKSLSLNMDQFNADLENGKTQRKIQTDRAIGNKVGVAGTPSFFIGSDELGADAVDDTIRQQGTKFMDALDKALRAIGETPPSRS